MNIHTFGGQPITTQEARRRGLPIRSSKGTASPRTRDGATYPGGKHLRRALAKLAARRDWRETTIREVSRDWPGIAQMHANVPGSMKG